MSNWVAYNAIDELKRLEPELDHLRAVTEAAKDYVDMLEASTCCPVTENIRKSRIEALFDAVNQYVEWEQDL